MTPGPPLHAAAAGEATDIILLAFNRPVHLERMVDAIEQRTRAPYRLTIVDNGSEADLRAWLHAERHRFHQVIFNRENLHLAGLQVGIERTTSQRYVVSDADLVPPEFDGDRCWLAELHALLDRHPDFGMIGSRIDGLPMPEWHRIGGAQTKVVDGEVLEGSTGVWLNMIRRDALRVPFQSDGMTCHALGRAGFRVGVGVELLCEHLGDLDPEVYPDYLARKNAANGFRSVYVEYPELQRVPRPPTLGECVLAAPMLAELREAGIAPEGVVELGDAAAAPVLSAVEPGVLGVGVAGGSTAWELCAGESVAPFADRSVLAVVVIDTVAHPQALVSEAARIAADRFLVLTPDPAFDAPAGFDLVERRPPNDVVRAMARWADRTASMRRVLGYATLERRADWLSLFEHARFGARALRIYECRREDTGSPRGPVREQARCASCDARPEPHCACGNVRRRVGPRPFRPPFARTLRGAMAARLTQVARAARVEWHTRRSR